jgi:hypothetical protein
MGSFGETDSGRSRLLSRPIPPKMPWVRLVIRWKRREDVEPRMEDGENEMVESKRNQPQMTQINADELKKFVK